MTVVLNARGQMQLLSAQLAGTQHAERSARIVNQIKRLISLAEKPVPVARLAGGNFDKAGDTSRVQDSIDPKRQIRCRGEQAFMNLTTKFRVSFNGRQKENQRGNIMRKAILGAASALAFASPAVAADLPVAPYSQAPIYQRETHTYEYRTAPPVVVEEPSPPSSFAALSL